MKRTAILMGILAILGIGVVASGTWCCLGWMMKRQMGQSSLLKSESWPTMLALTHQQRSQIEPMEKKLRNDLAPLDIEVAEKQMSVCRLMMSSGQVDRGAIHRALERISDLQRQKDEEIIDHLAAVRTLLNHDQREKLFTTLMTDLCRGCRAATGSKTDYCGMCKMR